MMFEPLRLAGWLIFMVVFALWLWFFPSKRDAFDPVFQFSRLKNRLSRFDFSKQWLLKHFIVVLVGILVCLALIFPAVQLSETSQEEVVGEEPITESHHPVNVIGGISPFLLGLALVFLPLIEEYLFRVELLGFIRRRLGGGVGASLLAVVAAGVGFGLFHLLNPGTGLFAFVPPMVLGFVFGFVFLVSGFWGAWVVHAGYNVVFLVLFA